MGRKGYPAKQLSDMCKREPDFVSNTIADAMVISAEGKPQTLEELKSRIDKYFETCANGSIRPGYEGLSLALHIPRSTLFNWRKGKGVPEEWKEVIEYASGIVDMVLEQALLQGKVSPPSGIFLAKNWLGYRDTISLEDATALKGEVETRRTPEQIAAEYGIVVDAEVIEDKAVVVS